MKHRNAIIFMLVLALVPGCGKKGPTKNQKIKAFNESGWSEIEDGNISRALAEFLDALELDETNLEARVGAGWAIIILDDRDLQIAVDYLDSTVTASTKWQLDAWAGLATISLSQPSYAAADSFATLALAGDTSYVFTFIPSINWRDLLLIQGQARFALSQYASAWQVIGPLIIDTPYEAVSATDSATWVDGEITYTHFELMLSIVIKYLSELYRNT